MLNMLSDMQVRKLSACITDEKRTKLMNKTISDKITLPGTLPANKQANVCNKKIYVWNLSEVLNSPHIAHYMNVT